MRFYKIINNGEVSGFSATEFDKSDCADYIEIDQSEYNDAIEQLRVKAETETEVAEQLKDECISNLEKENAALLFQILTGEEYADV